MRLYLVTATNTDYDTFDSAVVYANGPEDACEIVREACAGTDAPGAWFTIYGDQVLTAAPIERKRGPVHGYGRAG